MSSKPTSKEETRRMIETLYVRVRAGKDPDTGEYHIDPEDFYDEVIQLTQTKVAETLDKVLEIISPDAFNVAPNPFSDEDLLLQIQENAVEKFKSELRKQIINMKGKE
jgi:hypothetical protein